MDMRELKALELAARAKIVPADDGTWRIPSQSSGGTYKVCTWPGAESLWDGANWPSRRVCPKRHAVSRSN